MMNQIKILFQPSTIRAIPDIEYSQAGAEIEEDLSSCDIIYVLEMLEW